LVVAQGGSELAVKALQFWLIWGEQKQAMILPFLFLSLIIVRHGFLVCTAILASTKASILAQSARLWQWSARNLRHTRCCAHHSRRATRRLRIVPGH